MFNLRKRVENLENQLLIKPATITEEDLYKFYLEKRIDEINAKLKNEISYEIKIEMRTENEDKTYISLLAYPQKVLKIKIDKIDIFKREYNGWEINGEISDYKTILNYLNKKSIGYFTKLDKKIEDLKKHNKELEDKKLNLEEELKKII
jgi:hypothetical protein